MAVENTYSGSAIGLCYYMTQGTTFVLRINLYQCGTDSTPAPIVTSTFSGKLSIDGTNVLNLVEGQTLIKQGQNGLVFTLSSDITDPLSAGTYVFYINMQTTEGNVIELANGYIYLFKKAAI